MSERDTTAGRIEIETLGVIDRLGELGIRGVEERFEGLGDGATRVESELVKGGYVTPATVGEVTAFPSEERVAVQVGLAGVPHGYGFVAFPKSSANTAAALMMADVVDEFGTVDAAMAEDALSELGKTMVHGFLDAWANEFEVSIDVRTPTVLSDSVERLVETILSNDDELGVYLTSRLRVPAHGILAEVYLFPRTETFVEILDRLTLDAVVA